MDILAHMLYGATFCSRTGLAGGAKGPPVSRGRRISDWTVWAAILFGFLPDAVSFGPVLIANTFGGPGHFFTTLPADALIRYRYMHSLLVAAAGVGLIWLLWRPLSLPALAWPVHIGCDVFLHGVGKYHTTVFYPLSDWGYDGIRWWEHPVVVGGYWLVLVGIWIGLAVVRWRRRNMVGMPSAYMI